jgi:DNA-binding protein H-NS
MTKTYAQIVKQIETLTNEAEKLKRQEVDGVIARIKEAIGVYGLSAADLGLHEGGKSRPGIPSAKRAGRKPASKRKSAGIVRFRDQNNNQWTGFGPKPKWLRDALASGKDIAEFKV